MSQIVITYNLDGGNLDDAGTGYVTNSDKTVTTYSVTLPITVALTLPTPKKTGYTFNGWFLEKSETTGELSNQISQVIPGVSEDVTVYAKWSVSNDTKYIVVHVKEAIDDSNYNITNGTLTTANGLTSEEELTGTTNSVPSFVAKSYEGFSVTYDPSYYTYTKSGDNYILTATSSKVISAEGNTLVLQRYSRKIITFTFDALNGELSTSSKTIVGKYGATVASIPTAILAGYTSSWSPSVENTFDEDRTYTAVYTANTDTEYTVNAYYQTVDYDGNDKGPQPLTFNGTTGSLTNVTEDDIRSKLELAGIDVNNCTLESFTQQAILGAGTTVIPVHFKRNIVVVTFNFNGGTLSSSVTLPSSSTYPEVIEKTSSNLTIKIPAGHTIDFSDKNYASLLSSSSFTKVGYKCSGFTATGKQTYTKDTEYTLGFTPETYTIQYHIATDAETYSTANAQSEPAVYESNYKVLSYKNALKSNSTDDNTSISGYHHYGWKVSKTNVSEYITTTTDSYVTDSVISYLDYPTLADKDNIIHLYEVFTANAFTLTFKYEGSDKDSTGTEYYDIGKTVKHLTDSKALIHRASYFGDVNKNDDTVVGVPSRIEVLETYMNNANSFLEQTNKEAYTQDNSSNNKGNGYYLSYDSYVHAGKQYYIQNDKSTTGYDPVTISTSDDTSINPNTNAQPYYELISNDTTNKAETLQDYLYTKKAERFKYEVSKYNSQSANKVNHTLTSSTTQYAASVVGGSFNGLKDVTITSYKPDQDVNTGSDVQFKTLKTTDSASVGTTLDVVKSIVVGTTDTTGTTISSNSIVSSDTLNINGYTSKVNVNIGTADSTTTISGKTAIKTDSIPTYTLISSSIGKFGAPTTNSYATYTPSDTIYSYNGETATPIEITTTDSGSAISGLTKIDYSYAPQEGEVIYYINDNNITAAIYSSKCKETNGTEIYKDGSYYYGKAYIKKDNTKSSNVASDYFCGTLKGKAEQTVGKLTINPVSSLTHEDGIYTLNYNTRHAVEFSGLNDESIDIYVPDQDLNKLSSPTFDTLTVNTLSISQSQNIEVAYAKTLNMSDSGILVEQGSSKKTDTKTTVVKWPEIDGNYILYDTKSSSYTKATGTYVSGTTYYKDSTGSSIVDTSKFTPGSTSVSDFFIKSSVDNYSWASSSDGTIALTNINKDADFEVSTSSSKSTNVTIGNNTGSNTTTISIGTGSGKSTISIGNSNSGSSIVIGNESNKSNNNFNGNATSSTSSVLSSHVSTNDIGSSTYFLGAKSGTGDNVQDYDTGIKVTSSSISDSQNLTISSNSTLALAPSTTSSASTINIGEVISSGTSSTINIGNAASGKSSTVNAINGVGTGTLSIGNGSGQYTIGILSNNSTSTGSILNLGTSTSVANTINIGTGEITGKSTVTENTTRNISAATMTTIGNTQNRANNLFYGILSGGIKDASGTFDASTSSKAHLMYQTTDGGYTKFMASPSTGDYVLLSDGTTGFKWASQNSLTVGSAITCTGNAATAGKVANSLTINVNGNSTTYNGSSSQTATITCDTIGAAPTSSLTNGSVSKVGTSDVGTANKPIYLSGGTPTACTYELNATVPSGAVFTDTYSSYKFLYIDTQVYDSTGAQLGELIPSYTILVPSTVLSMDSILHYIGSGIVAPSGTKFYMHGYSTTPGNTSAADLATPSSGSTVYFNWTTTE